jgi:hypothetical protein
VPETLIKERLARELPVFESVAPAFFGEMRRALNAAKRAIVREGAKGEKQRRPDPERHPDAASPPKKNVV